MKTIVLHNQDKSAFGPGPWQDEPDKLQWLSETGLPCLIVRHHHLGFLCGYVGVPAGHPWYEKSYEGIDADVHGGLTYADHCQGDICHEVEGDNVWWLGFDTGHAWDLCPYMVGRIPYTRRDEWTYRDIDYVRSQVELLAAQAVSARHAERGAV